MTEIRHHTEVEVGLAARCRRRILAQDVRVVCPATPTGIKTRRRSAGIIYRWTLDRHGRQKQGRRMRQVMRHVESLAVGQRLGTVP